MAASESSIFWTTGSTGDGTTAYTQSQMFAWVMRTLQEGVLYYYASSLGISASSNILTVATGAAVIRGIPYENTANFNLTIPTPVAGTTGYNIVLRADYTAQTVRVVAKGSADGVSSIPALTQNINSLWEISLYTLTITTGNVISLTDSRTYTYFNTRVSTAMIDNMAITSAKVANNAITSAAIAPSSVSGSQIVANTIQASNIVNNTITNTQIANATITNTQIAASTITGSNIASGTVTFANLGYMGTASNIALGNVRIQTGTGTGNSTVTFPLAFTSTPLVVCTPNADPEITVVVTTVSSTQVLVKTYSGTSLVNSNFNYIAVGLL